MIFTRYKNPNPIPSELANLSTNAFMIDNPSIGKDGCNTVLIP